MWKGRAGSLQHGADEQEGELAVDDGRHSAEKLKDRFDHLAEGSLSALATVPPRGYDLGSRCKISSTGSPTSGTPPNPVPVCSFLKRAMPIS